MKKRLSGLFSFNKGKPSTGQGTRLLPGKPALSRDQLSSLENCFQFIDAAVLEQAENDGDPLPLNLYTSYGDSYAGEASSKAQVQELEDAFEAGGGAVERLVARRVCTGDLSPHFVALAVRNVLLDHAPLCGYEVYDAVMGGSSSDTKKWAVLLAPMPNENRQALLALLVHLQTLAGAATSRRLGPRGMGLDSLLSALAPLVLSDDPADPETQQAQKARLGSDLLPLPVTGGGRGEAAGGRQARVQARVTRVKQLLKSDFRAVLAPLPPVPRTEAEPAGPGVGARAGSPLVLLPALGSVQSRSVKITFPRGASSGDR